MSNGHRCKQAFYVNISHVVFSLSVYPFKIIICIVSRVRISFTPYDPHCHSFFHFISAGVTDSFSVKLCGPHDDPTSDDVATGGSLTFGGIDVSQYIGDLMIAGLDDKTFYKIVISDISVSTGGSRFEQEVATFFKVVNMTTERIADRVWSFNLAELSWNNWPVKFPAYN